MRIRYSLRAFADRESIYDYLEKRSPQGARNVKLAIVQAIRSLALHPRLGRITDKLGVHELIVPRRPYRPQFGCLFFCREVFFGEACLSAAFVAAFTPPSELPRYCSILRAAA